MNAKEKKIIAGNWHSYHILKQSHHKTIKRNAVFIHLPNSFKHELYKFVACFMIKKYNDVKFTPELRARIEAVVFRFDWEFATWQENHSEFLTEAVPNDEPKRIVDVVNLREPDQKLRNIEFETDHKILKENTTTIYI